MTRALDDTEVLALIDALSDGGWHSGERLAAVSGISRAALAKRVDHLQDWALTVESRAGLGYRLAAPLERLEAEAIRAALPRKLRGALARIEVLPRTDSTNTRLLEGGADGDPQALFAEMQTAGRGRRGREWRSPFAANLYLSLAWSFNAWPPQVGTLPLTVGVACARALRAVGLDTVRLKWPNDLRVGARKLGGILIEPRGETGGTCRVVIGIGLNFAMTPEQAGALDQPWTTVLTALAEAGAAPVSRNTVAAKLLEALLLALPDYARNGFAPFAPEWNALDAVAGAAVRLEAPDGNIEGVACGIDDSGALLIDSGGRQHRALAGDVSLRLRASSGQENRA